MRQDTRPGVDRSVFLGGDISTQHQIRNFMLKEFKSCFCLTCHVTFSRAFTTVSASVLEQEEQDELLLSTVHDLKKNAYKTPWNEALKPIIIHHNVSSFYST